MDPKFEQGDEIADIIVDERVDEADLKKHLAAIFTQASAASSLSPEARALAESGDVFELSRGANTLIVEGTIAYVFVMAVAKGGGTALGALAVNELWGFVRDRLQGRDPTGIHDIRDKQKPSPSDPSSPE